MSAALEARARERREAVVLCATTLYARGYAGATRRAIAAAVDVSSDFLDAHFPGETLLLRAAEHHLAGLSAAVAAADDPSADALPRLTRMALALSAAATADAEGARTAAIAEVILSPIAARDLMVRARWLVEPFTEALERMLPEPARGAAGEAARALVRLARDGQPRHGLAAALGQREQGGA